MEDLAWLARANSEDVQSQPAAWSDRAVEPAGEMWF